MMAVIIFFGYCFQYMLKINMSISIVCMVNYTSVNVASNPTTSRSENSSIKYDECSIKSSNHAKYNVFDIIFRKGTLIEIYI